MTSKATVHFTNFRATPKLNLLDKLKKLVFAAGFNDIDFTNKFTALKIHFGEPGNLAYIRPNYAAQIVDLVKQAGGKPFLTDSNTLYSGKRANAIDHIESATKNGFAEVVTGCPVIIADGLKGTDQDEVEINLEHCKHARIGKAVNAADVIVSINHFKGHEMAGFGGALKNLGMGCASVGGKLILHSTSKPKINTSNCIGCNICVKKCAHNAIHLDKDKKAIINYDNCVGCGQCVAECQYDAAQVVWENASELMNEKVAEYAYAVVKNKPSLHINFMTDISPNCDCWGHNDYPLVPNIGIAASTDPVALDQACADMVSKEPILKQSVIGENHLHNEDCDKFAMVHPNTDWQAGIKHAKKIGLGTTNYTIIEI